MARRSLTRHPHTWHRTFGFHETPVDTALMALVSPIAGVRIIQIVNGMRGVHTLVRHGALAWIGRSTGA